MKTIFHPAHERGYANHGWLEANHSFSFASWQNPDKVHFGALRVLNDDKVAGHMGFGTHPHDNMEIITIPLSGSLRHKDSMGFEETFSQGEIQVMSAGTGIYHSEMNPKGEDLCLFQIWIFPNKRNVEPRYQQKKLNTKENEISCILQPTEHEDTVWIHQEAYMHLGTFNTASETSYSLKNLENGIYIMNIEGELTVNQQQLGKRDAIGIWETDKVAIQTSANSRFLIIEVPMIF